MGPPLDMVPSIDPGALRNSRRVLQANIEVGPPLDTADLTSVRAFAEAFLRSGRPLHVLINNAGTMSVNEPPAASGAVAGGMGHVSKPEGGGLVDCRPASSAVMAPLTVMAVTVGEGGEGGEGRVPPLPSAQPEAREGGAPDGISKPAPSAATVPLTVTPLVATNYLGAYYLNRLLEEPLKRAGSAGAGGRARGHGVLPHAPRDQGHAQRARVPLRPRLRRVQAHQARGRALRVRGRATARPRRRLLLRRGPGRREGSVLARVRA